MTVLVIVESPAKCKKIESFLGPGYTCMATFGHFRELPSLDNVAIGRNFQPTFVPMKSKSSQIQKLKKAIASSSDVILATDDDREGEGIAWHVCSYFGLSVTSTKRIIFREITEGAVLAAVATPKTLDCNLVNAQQARQILDLIVGFKLSPVLWSQITQRSKTGLSAGRCQTPALRLVYENQREIDAAPGERAYTTIGYFGEKNIAFTLSHMFSAQDEVEEFLTRSVGHRHCLSRSQQKTVSKAPPLPYTTSTVQQASNNEYRLSPKDTMKSLQALYEAGHITYMRTDSKRYSLEFLGSAMTYIGRQWGDKFIAEELEERLGMGSDKAEDGDANAQQAHEAIRPTKVGVRELPEDELTPRDRKLYVMIWRNTLESCMKPALYQSVVCGLSAPLEHVYKSSFEKLMFAGWHVVRGTDLSDRWFDYVLLLGQGAVLPYNKISSKVTLKNLKQHYTEARLVQMLEKKGIGRPSTFSSLVEKIQARQYVKKGNVPGKKVDCVDFELVGNELEEISEERTFGAEKGKLVLQPLGVIVLEFLLKHFGDLFEYAYTSGMEDQLDKVASGERVWHDVCRECHGEIEDAVARLEPSSKEDIVIDKDHKYIIGKHGPVIKCTTGGKTTFKGVREDIDLDRLRTGGYSLSDIVKESVGDGTVLGKHQGNVVVLKHGKFGPYIHWQETNRSLASLGLTEDGLKLDDVVQKLGAAPGVIRVLGKSTSLRSGKYGDYVYHKKQGMTKPKFINLKGFDGEARTCPMDEIVAWLLREHKVSV